MSESNNSKKLSMITIIISIIAALGIIAVGVMMYMKAGNMAMLNVISAGLMIVIAIANFVRAYVIDKQKSLMVIWGAATLIFIGGLVFAIISL